MASPLVLAELCGHGEVRAAHDVTQVDKIVNDFFRHPFVHWVELDVPLAYEARVLSRRYRLRGSDAVHLASAIRTKCDALMTWDRGFPIGETVEGVRVMEPSAHPSNPTGGFGAGGRLSGRARSPFRWSRLRPRPVAAKPCRLGLPT